MIATAPNAIMQLYLQEIGKTNLLTPQEELELAERAMDGDQVARDHLVQANLRLVVKIAKEYADYGVPLADLISEGNIGLVKAVSRYNPAKGGKLSTYAAWWIKQGITRALSYQGKVVRLPVHVTEKVSRVRRIKAMMANELGRDPSDDELSETLGISKNKLVLLKQVTLREASLDAPVAGDDTSRLGDLLGDDEAMNPFEQLSHKGLRSELTYLLDLLDERERKIITARFGLNDQTPLTLEEIGIDFGITRERIRQIQKAALEKMRHALHKKDAPKLPVAPARCG